MCVVFNTHKYRYKNSNNIVYRNSISINTYVCCFQHTFSMDFKMQLIK